MNAVRFVKVRLAVEAATMGLVLVGAFSQPYRMVVVNGNSMSPTYRDGSILMSKRLTDPVYRGEVVVMDSPVGMVIKRIAFLPGDRITQMRLGKTWVDVVDIKVATKKASYIPSRLFTIPAGQVYVIGDNFSNSIDSTTFGPIPIKDIWGSVLDQRTRMKDGKESSTMYWLYNKA